MLFREMITISAWYLKSSTSSHVNTNIFLQYTTSIITVLSHKFTKPLYFLHFHALAHCRYMSFKIKIKKMKMKSITFLVVLSFLCGDECILYVVYTMLNIKWVYLQRSRYFRTSCVDKSPIHVETRK